MSGMCTVEFDGMPSHLGTWETLWEQQSCIKELWLATPRFCKLPVTETESLYPGSFGNPYSSPHFEK